MRHVDPVRAEMQAQFDALSERISTTEQTLALTTDHQQQLVLATLRDDLYAERGDLAKRIIESSRMTVGVAKGADVEYDELTRMVYEIRTDVAIMKRQFEDHITHCNADTAEFPPHFLTFLAVGGVVMLLLMAFIVIRIGISG